MNGIQKPTWPLKLTSNNNNQNDSIYNEWNTTNNMAADINIKIDKKKKHSSDKQ